MPDYSLEQGHKGYVIGVDEVGRGPLAGPVMAAALCFFTQPVAALADLLDDSKKLSLKRREVAYRALCGAQGHMLYFALGGASCHEIERLNIGGACHLAMSRAVQRISSMLDRKPVLALVDGTHKPNLSCPVQMVVGGDSKSFSIAAASIIAKVTRDRLMGQLARRYPYYGWEKNAGYGTKIHKAGLRHYGITPHHRRSFAPVRALAASQAGQDNVTVITEKSMEYFMEGLVRS